MRHFRWVDPSLEVRYAYVSGSAVSEKTLSGGIKVEKRVGPGGIIHPYADVTIGYGVIDFKHPVIYATGPYASDNSTVYGIGGGLDVDLTSHFAVKGRQPPALG
jgi:opacity protein-like surface antigen